LHVGIVLIVYLSEPSQLVVELEVGSWDYFEEGISIVFEVELILVGLVDGHGVCKSLSGEVSLILLSRGEPTDEDSLSVRKIISLLSFGHVDMFSTI